MANWLPIETAPRDNTRILAFFPAYEILKGKRAARQAVVWATKRGRWQHGDGAGIATQYPPTHWKPLEEGPE